MTATEKRADGRQPQSGGTSREAGRSTGGWRDRRTGKYVPTSKAQDAMSG